MRIPHPRLGRALLARQHSGHAGRIDPDERDAVARDEAERRGRGVDLGEAAALEGVRDDGQVRGPVGARGGAPEGQEGEEDVLV